MKTLDDICQPVATELNDVRKHVLNRLTESQVFASVGEYLGERRGKFIRSAMVIMASRLFHGKDAGVTVGAACELIHLATLLHDDVLDRAPTRRGADSVNERFGNGMAILTGDFLYCQAFSLLPETNRHQVTLELLAAGRKMCEGQVIEMEVAFQPETSIEQYMQIITGKTAAFFEHCARSGAILSGAPEESVTILGQYGLHFGLAFQMTDDLLDLESDGQELGKPVLKDLQEGHYTPAILHTLADPDYGQAMRALLARNTIEENAKEIRLLVKKADGFEHARKLAAEEGRIALDALNQLSGVDRTLVEPLQDLVTFVINRSH